VNAFGRSDHEAFADADVPTGGIYSGGDADATADEAATFGVVEGEPFDPCYHQPCDTLDNVDVDAVVEAAATIIAVLRTLDAGESR
jgi:hypothetical protein